MRVFILVQWDACRFTSQAVKQFTGKALFYAGRPIILVRPFVQYLAYVLRRLLAVPISSSNCRHPEVVAI